MKRTLILPTSLFFLSIVLYIISHSYLFSLDPRYTETASRKWRMPTPVLEALSVEFHGLMANFMLLEAGALIGPLISRGKGGIYIEEKSEVDKETLIRLLNHSVLLDPYFKQTFISIQGWLPWYGDAYVNETNRLLNIASTARWWDWQPLQLIGFNTYYFLKNRGEAGKLFLEASKRKTAPPYLAILGARLAQKGNQTQAAIALMKSMLSNKDEDAPGYKSIYDRLLALEGVLKIELALEQFKKKYYGLPINLEELVAKGFLDDFPYNPYNYKYCFNIKGEVFFDNPACQM